MSNEIAIVGMSLRLPGAADSRELWSNLIAGHCALGEVPRQRWDWRELSQRWFGEAKEQLRWGGFIDDVDRFDALFFNISPAEAPIIDPQQRLILEHTWNCFEDAQIAPSSCRGQDVGVFIGSCNNDYKEIVDRAGAEVPGHYLLGTGPFCIANRLSYFLQVHGPSFTVDTACSSGLVALHHAVKSLQRQECKLAVAGAVNLLLAPERYLSFVRMNMLSPSGRCSTFSAQADGYVRSEGVVVFLLKPLDQALADGDRVHAVIKGCAVNHDGHSANITSPNMYAQARVIAAALRDANVDSRSVTYFEAHGTGTPVGDPIEILGIKRALARAGGDGWSEGWIGIGSVKTNIGHLEAASGLAGVVKVILAMREGRIPGLSNFGELNPRIRVDKSPFQIVDVARDWEAPAGPEGQPGKRRAGVSSFGIGGANAHVILEEPPLRAQGSGPGALPQPRLFVLSAKSPAALGKRASELLARLDADPPAGALARALSGGREHLPHRLAVEAASVGELRARLSAAFGKSDEPQPHVWRGKAKSKPRESSPCASGGGEVALAALAQSWVDGDDSALPPLEERAAGPWLDLPAYCFERRRFWVELPPSNAAPPASGQLDLALSLNPRSDGLGLDCRWSASSALLAHHVIDGSVLLPGAATLVLLRAAAKPLVASAGIRIKNLVWLQPARPQPAGLELGVGLSVAGSGWSFRVTLAGDAGDHARGSLEPIEAEPAAPPSAPPSAQTQRYGRGEIYRKLASAGYQYGPAYQAIESLSESGGIVVAKFEATHDVAVLDAALQATSAFHFASAPDGAVRFPFCIEEAIFSGPLPRQGKIVVQSAGGDASTDRFHLWICDPDDSTRVELRDFVVRRRGSGLRLEAAAAEREDAVLIYAPSWQKQPETELEIADTSQDAAETLVIPADQRADGALPDRCTKVVYWIDPLEPSWDRFVGEAERLCEWTQLWVASRRALKILLLCRPGILVPAQAWAGFARSISLECERLSFQVTQLDADAASPLQASIARELEHFEAGGVVRRIGRERHVERLCEQRTPVSTPTSGAQTVLISGGFGGLGRMLAVKLAVPGARLLLTSRSARDADKLEFLEQLRSLGAEAQHVETALDDPERLASTLASLLGERPRLDLIIHSAGTTRDGLFIRQQQADRLPVLEPKVRGAYVIDAATRGFEIGRFICFSSVAAAAGNVGQSSYALANGFLCDFVAYRNALSARGERSGTALAIDWPYWSEGGMRLSAAEQERMFARTGLRGLDGARGWQTFLRCAADERERSVVLSGSPTKLVAWLGARCETAAGSFDGAVRSLPETDAPAPVPSSAAPAEQDGAAALEREVARLCSEILRIDNAEFDVEAEFAEYGMDSVLMMRLLDAIERAFERPITANTVMDHPTARRLALQLWSMNFRSRTAAAPTPVRALVASTRTPANAPGDRASASAQGSSSEPIAIVGVACRFPRSAGPSQFWDNLVAGRSLISRVPEDRWHISRLLAPKGQNGHSCHSHWAGVIEGVDEFDPGFFGIAHETATVMDPQQRILLELTQHVLDDAGYESDALRGARVGVFLGGGDSWYLGNGYSAVPDARMPQIMVSSIPNMMAGRIADVFDWAGPALVIDTACSSALVAVHEACKSLREGECNVAVAGGIELLLNERCHVGFSQAKVLSDSERAFVFDERANGFVLGEGGGLVLLKPLSAAIAAGDRIYAVIRGSAVNNDGKTLGLTLPNMARQQEVIELALEKSQLEPGLVQYLEAHGTGTLLGDPIEIKAASRAYGKGGGATGFCAVASVKSNLGHLLRAAGAASLIKMALALHHRVMPPTLNCERPHPRFGFAETPFYPILQARPWPELRGRRCAAISSFGFGGTNCHMLLESHPASTAEQPGRAPRALTRFERQKFPLLRTGHAEAPAAAAVLARRFQHGESYLRDHTVLGRQVLLGVTHISLAIENFRMRAPRAAGCELKSVVLTRALHLDPGESAALEIELEGDPEPIHFTSQFRKTSETSETAPAIRTASGEYGSDTHIALGPIDVSAGLEQNPAAAVDPGYGRSPAIVHGQTLRTVQWVRRLDGAGGAAGTLARLELHSEYHTGSSALAVHPALWDGAIVAALALTRLPPDALYVPYAVRRVVQRSAPIQACYAYGRVERSSEEVLVLDTYLLDASGTPLGALEGVTCKRVRSAGMFFEPPRSERKAPAAPAKTPAHATPPAGAGLSAAIASYLSRLLATSFDLRGEPSSGVNFLELGIESNDLIALTQRIEQEFEIELYPTLFFEYPNIDSLAEFLAKEHAARFAVLARAPAAAAPGRASAEPAAVDATPRIRAGVEPAVATPAKDIAIIGMAGRFGGADDVDEFWQRVLRGDDLMSEVPADHWDVKPWFEPAGSSRRPDSTYCKWGSFVRDVRRFDAEFFRVSPKEAKLMDPQLRHLLEIIYHTAEDAGYASRLRGSNTGLYVGCCFSDYAQEMDRLGLPASSYVGTGNAKTMLANRPSYYLDLTGPSLCVDTACSSSLVALHMAVQALRNGECEMALVAGVNLLLGSWHYRYFSSLEALSASGRCHSFDARADGYVPGEAVAAVLLKPLSQAARDGDRIRAVIKGSAVNHGGHAPAITAPNLQREREVLLRAWDDAGIDASTLGYIEAHGTGTKLGDPIETQALRQAFRQFTNQRAFCAIGSAKAHIGHTEGAAGVVGVIKAALSLSTGSIPRMPDFRQANPYLGLDDSALYINERCVPWPRNESAPRRAGVSSFGFGGTYAHVVLEEREHSPPTTRAPIPPGTWFPFTLSAHTAQSLQRSAQRHLSYIEGLRSAARDERGAPLLASSIAEQLGVDAGDLDPDESLAGLGLELADVDRLVARLRDAGHGSISRELVAGAHTLRDLAALIDGEATRASAAGGDASRALMDVLFTLQTTREAQRVRLGFPVQTLDDVARGLQRFLAGDTSQLRIGEANPASDRGAELPITLGVGPACAELVERRLLEWTGGAAIDWRAAYEPYGPRLTDTPLYSFTGAEHWFGEEAAQHGAQLPSARRREMSQQLPGAVTSPSLYEIATRRVQLRLGPELQGLLVLDQTGECELGPAPAALRILRHGPASDTACDFSDVSALSERLHRMRSELPLPASVLVMLDAHVQGEQVASLARSCAFLSSLAALLAPGNPLEGCSSVLLSIQPTRATSELAPECLSVAARSLGALCHGKSFRFLTDLDADAPSDRVAAACQILQHEGNQVEFVRRGGVTVSPELKEAAGDEFRAVRLRQRGTYLLFGGSGALGRIFSERLIAAYDARVVITGRSPHAPSWASRWPDHLRYVACDAASPGALEALMRELDAQGPLHGVLFLAGMLDARPLTQKTAADLRAALRAKVADAAALDAALGARELDFFAAFSSVSSILGDFGQCDYAVANRYLDGLMRDREQRAQRGTRSGATFAIAWPLWREGGIGFGEQGTALYLSSSGFRALDSDAGFATFERVLGSGLRQVVVIDGDRQRFEPTLVRAGLLPEHAGRVAPRAMATPTARPSSSAGRSLSDLETGLSAIVRSHLDTPTAEVPLQENLGNLGIDSLALKEIANDIRARFGVAISPTIFFEHSTISSLARFLSGEIDAARGSSAPALFQDARDVSQTEAIDGDASAGLAARESDVAIIGLDARFPGADDADQYRELLERARSAIGGFPRERFDTSRHDALPVPRVGGFITGVERFDAEFFKISPHEAELMDPQQRLMLTCAWRALEDAGCPPSCLRRRPVGVFVGAQFSDYRDLLDESGARAPHASIGMANALIANRVSYFFDFRGPSETIDTACSSSLVALHRAVLAVQRGEVELALAGGISLLLSLATMQRVANLGVLSPEGKCKPFDAAADGYVRGEGYGLVVLKPLGKALADGDNIRAIIRASGDAHGGNANTITAPNADAQRALLVDVYRRADIDPADVDYVEVHGTGTELGDPVEVGALDEAFRSIAELRGSELAPGACGIGSVKANIGHLEPASGIAGLVKVVLAMERGVLPGHPHLARTNPLIRLDTSPLRIVHQTESLSRRTKAGQIKPFVMGVSSFGFGGSIAHVVLGEAPARSRSSSSSREQILPISARTKRDLLAYRDVLLEFVRSAAPGSLDLSALCWTLQSGREEMSERAAVVFADSAQLSNGLAALSGGVSAAAAATDCMCGRAEPAAGTTLRAEVEAALDAADRIQLAKLWVRGAEVPWRRLHDTLPRRISAPAHPFGGERHWVAPAVPGGERALELASRDEPNARTEHVFFEERWSPAAPLPVADGSLDLLVVGADDFAHASERRELRGILDAVSAGPAQYLERRAAGRCGELYAQLRGERRAVVYFAEHTDLDDRFELEAHARGLLECCQSLLRVGSGKPLELYYVYRGARGPGAALHTGALAALRSIALEQPAFGFASIELEPESRAQSIRDWLVPQLRAGAHGRELRQTRTELLVRSVEQVDVAPASERAEVWPLHGTILISGGAGELGRLLVRHIEMRSAALRSAVTIAVIGRSSSERAGHRLNVGAGERVRYYECDVSDPQAVVDVVQRITREQGPIRGLFHCAGEAFDAYLTRKDLTQLRRELAAKALGALNLDRATRECSLDVFCLYSSLVSLFGNAGQAGYAYANGFVDGFAAWRNAERLAGRRQGRTVSVRWPLWERSGISLSTREREFLMSTFGAQPLAAEQGLGILEQALASGAEAVAMVRANPERLRSALRERSRRAPEGRASASTGDGPLQRRAQEYLRGVFSSLLKLPAAQLDVRARFQELGVDSFLIKAFNQRMEGALGRLSKTLLFEFHDIESLAAHLVAQHRDALAALVGADVEAAPHPDVAVPEERAAASRALPWQAPSGKPPGADIAIIGVHARLPGADDLEAFWQVLALGVDCVSEVPSERWDVSRYFDPDPVRASHGKMYCKWGGFLRDVFRFDNELFRISPREAEKVDPQERLMLESAYLALEDAGYCKSGLERQGLNRRVGVFIGATSFTYALNGCQLDGEGELIIPNSSAWSLANRISYVFNLGGPSLPADTACSASLTALHLACRSIRDGECNMALVGGVNLYTHPSKYIDMCQARMLSPTGRCRTFSAAADGFVPGEGAVTLVLKALSAAVTDGDRIYGVIKGTGLNHGGLTNGYTVPNPAAQAELIASTLRSAGVEPNTITYVEAHGTGTLLGDPVEVSGLTRAFGTRNGAAQAALGSVKSNIGHLEAAAGLAGIVKILLQFSRGQLPPSLHADELNPNIDFAACPFGVQRTLAPWPRLEAGGREVPRRAAVSSFGAGGSNGHAILEEWIETRPRHVAPGPYIFPFSARDRRRLTGTLRQLALRLDSSAPGEDLAELAYSLQVGREPYSERVAFVAATAQQLTEKVVAYLDDPRERDGVHLGNVQPQQLAIWQSDPADFEPVVRAWGALGAGHKIADYWSKGGALDWRWLYGAGDCPRRTRAPGAALQRNEFRLPALGELFMAGPAALAGGARLHPYIATNDSTLYQQRYSGAFDRDMEVVRDHRVGGSIVLPGVIYLELALAAARRAFEEPICALADVVWKQPLALDEGARRVHVDITPQDARVIVSISSLPVARREGECSIEHMTATISRATPTGILSARPDQLAAALPRALAGAELYAALGQAGLAYGASLQTIDTLRYGDGEAVARLVPRVSLQGHLLRPDLLDGAFQALAGVLLGTGESATHAFLPFSMRHLMLARELPAEACYAHVKLRSQGASCSPAGAMLRADLKLLTDDGSVLAELEDLCIRRQPAAEDQAILEVLRRYAAQDLSLNEATTMLQGV